LSLLAVVLADYAAVRAGDETEIAFDGMPALLSTGILSRLSEKGHLQDPALQQSTVFVHRPLPLVAVSAKLTQILDDAEGYTAKVGTGSPP
jgi:hypothetical protein